MFLSMNAHTLVHITNKINKQYLSSMGNARWLRCCSLVCMMHCGRCCMVQGQGSDLSTYMALSWLCLTARAPSFDNCLSQESVHCAASAGSSFPGFLCPCCYCVCCCGMLCRHPAPPGVQLLPGDGSWSTLLLGSVATAAVVQGMVQMFRRKPRKSSQTS